MRHDNDDAIQQVEDKPTLSAYEAKKPVKRKTTDDEKTVKKSANGKAPDIVTLSDICKELKMKTRDARAILRKSDKLKHRKGQAWEWPRSSQELKTVKALLRE